MNRFGALALAAALLVAPATAAAQTETVIKVGVLPAEVSGQTFYGLDQGFFKKNGLDVQLEFFTNGGAIAAGVASGALDMGLSDVVSVVNAHARGLPFVYIAPGLLMTEKAPTFAFIVAKDGPRDAKDFNGKTIAVNGLKNISQLGAETWIDNNGGDSKTVKWVEIPIPAMAAAIAAGTITGGLPNEPVLTNAAEGGDRVVFMDKNALAPAYLLSGWIVTRAWADGHPAIAAKLAAGLREAADWANKNQKAGSPILAKYSKIPLPVIERMHRGDFSTKFDGTVIQPVIEAAVKYGFITKSFPAAEIIYAAK